MKILRWLAVSFSMYSKIPMPRFDWREEDMAKSLIFFPLVGVIIGGLLFFVNAVSPFSGLPVAVRIILTLVLPLLVTGGFHTDGFMDTADALHSYAETEKKLEILKDPHVGAFAVIAVVKQLLLCALAITAILLYPQTNRSTLLLLALTFVLSRALSGLTSILMPKAKKDGMLVSETKNGKGATVVVLVIWALVAAGLMVYLHWFYGCVMLAFMAGFTLYYRYKMRKEFGGVTGDTAGWFVTVSETLMALALAVALYIYPLVS
ncbi:MAG: adenosylcobinamide-GDP ribazoletransferase [Lachnospiraceae bacterium]|nr:adenosylcobinamide-GDP ribazoletransferase [Lachnospiraceae bacterium]